MEEIWKEIRGFEGYEVSNYGRIRSFRNNFKVKSRDKFIILKISKGKCGYAQNGLNRNGKVVSVKLHRIVAIAFIPNPENKPQINHIDGVKTNNCVTNLEWATARENIVHAIKMGLLKPPIIYGKFGSLNSNSKEIYQFTMDGTFVKKYDAIMYACAETGASPSHVGNCARDKRKSSGGYRWSFSKTLEK